MGMMCYCSPSYSWIWTEGGQNSDLESNLDVGGFGYPVGATLDKNTHKNCVCHI